MGTPQIADTPWMTWPTVREASYALNCTTKTIYTLLGSGRLSGVKTRLGWLVDPQSIEARRLARQSKGRAA